MSTKIVITSLYNFITYLEDYKGYNIISIRDSYPSQNNKNIYKMIDKKVPSSDLYVLNMDDIDSNIDDCLKHYPLLKIPSKELISPLIDWCKIKIKNNNNFVVHCTAGISRSSSIAILIQCLLTPNDVSKITSIIDPELHYPNKLVIQLIEELLELKV